MVLILLFRRSQPTSSFTAFGFCCLSEMSARIISTVLHLCGFIGGKIHFGGINEEENGGENFWSPCIYWTFVGFRLARGVGIRIALREWLAFSGG
jgi:hypothetical protein